MYSVLLSFFDSPIRQNLENVCQKSGETQVFIANTKEEFTILCEQQHFDCFLFHFDWDFIEVRDIVSYLRTIPHYIHTPVMLFSSRMEFLVSAFVKWHTCEFFLLPLNEQKVAEIEGLLYYYEGIHRKIRATETNLCQIHTPKGMFNIHSQDILFVESTMKKSIIHLKDGTIHLSVPLYRVKEMLHFDNFVQTHRSFIINTANISYIDKTKEPWGVFFFDSTKEAFVSRSHKKLLPHYLSFSYEEKQELLEFK